jgi:hypothetical protein
MAKTKMTSGAGAAGGSEDDPGQRDAAMPCATTSMVARLVALISATIRTVTTHFSPDFDALVSASVLAEHVDAEVQFRSANDRVGQHEAGVVGVDIADGPRSFKGAAPNGGRGSAAWLVRQALRECGVEISAQAERLIQIADEIDRGVQRRVSYGVGHLFNGLNDIAQIDDGDLVNLMRAIVAADVRRFDEVVEELAAKLRTQTGVRPNIILGPSAESELSAAVALASSSMAGRLERNLRHTTANAIVDGARISARLSRLQHARDLRSALRDCGRTPNLAERTRMIDAICDLGGELQELLCFATFNSRTKLLALALTGAACAARETRASRWAMHRALDDACDQVLVITGVGSPRAVKGAARHRQALDAGVSFVVIHGSDGSTRVLPTANGTAWLSASGTTFESWARRILPEPFHVEAWAAVCGSKKAWRIPPAHDVAGVVAAIRESVERGTA